MVFFLLGWHDLVAETGAPDDLRLIAVIFRLLDRALSKLGYDRYVFVNVL
jgi:hypothetical protein